MEQAENPTIKQIPQFKVWDNDVKGWIKNPCLADDNHVFTIHDIGMDFDEHGNQFGGGDAIVYYDNPKICRFAGVVFNDVPVYEWDLLDVNINGVFADAAMIRFDYGGFGFYWCGTWCYLDAYSQEIKNYLGSSLSNPELLKEVK